MKKYKAVGFDYGGVIGGGPMVGKEYTAQVCEILGMDQETYRKEYFKMNHLLNTGKVDSWRDFWKLFLAKFNISEDKLDDLTKLNEKTAKHYVVMNNEVLALIDELRTKGYKIGLLSNATMDSGRELRSAGLPSRFDTFFISAEIGIQKPDPEIYQRFAKALNIELSELVFIDDTPRNLDAAKELGISTILYTDTKSLSIELKDLGIL